MTLLISCACNLADEKMWPGSSLHKQHALSFYAVVMQFFLFSYLLELRRDSRLAESVGQKTSVLKPATVKDINIPSSMENTLAVLLRKLNDKRKEARRPEENCGEQVKCLLLPIVGFILNAFMSMILALAHYVINVT
jgi:hypothetical protein